MVWELKIQPTIWWATSISRVASLELVWLLLGHDANSIFVARVSSNDSALAVEAEFVNFRPNHNNFVSSSSHNRQGGQRFNAYGPARLAQGNIDQWYKDVHASLPGKWIAGPGCCSKDTVSFHYVGPAEARAMHHILHNRER